MKHSAFAVALLLAASAVTVAQAPPPGRPPGGPPIEALAKDLGLDDTQKAELKRIFEAERTKHEQAAAEMRRQLSTVLSAEQLAKFEAMRKEHRPPREPREQDN